MEMVNAENTNFYYFSQQENPRDQALPLFCSGPETPVVSLVKTHNDIRLAIFRSMLNPYEGNFYILYWNNGANLIDLDQRVLRRSYTDADFQFSVKTVCQNTICEKCKHVSNTLVIPPGDPYPGAPRLLEKKISISDFKLCPNCHSPFRQMVVKVFD